MLVFPECSLQDEDGFSRNCNEFHPGLFVWLRQLGCRFARQQAAQLAQLEIPEEVKLVLITPSAPADCRAFRRGRLPHTACVLLCDTRLRTHSIFGFQRSAARPNWFKGLLARLQFGQGPVQGDERQNGGVVITHASGEIHYRYSSRDAGDHPGREDLLRALRKLRV